MQSLISSVGVIIACLCSVMSLYKSIVSPAVKFAQLQERIATLQEQLRNSFVYPTQELQKKIEKIDEHDKLLERILTLLEQNATDIKELKSDIKEVVKTNRG